MARKSTPSSVMYRLLKSFGISNREAAYMLLNTSLTFDGSTLVSRIEDSSQLTRRVVHVDPGEIPVGMFNRFQLACPQLHLRILEKMRDSVQCSEEEASVSLYNTLRGPGSECMLAVLSNYHIDVASFRNMLVYIDHADLDNNRDRSLMLLMLLVIVRCTANPRAASIIVLDYATNIMGADYHTAQTVFNNDSIGLVDTKQNCLGLVRITDGYILKGTPMHVLNPAGTTIGLMPSVKHSIIDVGEDVSREHALIWRNGDTCWFIQDLSSTNGTRLLRRGSEEVIRVRNVPVELGETDIICLGSTTRFMVLPIMDPEATWDVS